MRYWNPRRAAAHRIADDAMKQYGAERVGQLLERLKPGTPPEEAMNTERPPSSSPSDASDPSLSVRLSMLLNLDPRMFQMFREEFSKYRTRQGSTAGA